MDGMHVHALRTSQHTLPNKFSRAGRPPGAGRPATGAGRRRAPGGGRWAAGDGRRAAVAGRPVE